MSEEVVKKSEEFVRMYEIREKQFTIIRFFMVMMVIIQVLTTVQQVTGIPINVLLYILQLKIIELPKILAQLQFLHPYVANIVLALVIFDLLYSSKAFEKTIVGEKPSIGIAMTISLIQINLCIMEYVWTGYVVPYLVYCIYYTIAYISTVIALRSRV